MVGLTDTGFLVLLVIATVLVFGLAVWLTGRLHGRVWHVPLRAGLILVTCLLTLLSVGTWLNDANGWYTSWADLAGQDAPATTTNQGPAAAQAAAAPDGQAAREQRPAASYPALPVSGSRRQTYTWHGPRSGVTTTIDVILPRDYFDASQRDRMYPVIEAFHGIPGTPSGWTKTMGLPDAVDAAVSARRIADPIVVVPQLAPSLGRDRECVNGPPGSPQLETWLTTDVPAFVRSHFRATADRSGWAALGYSAGGWCAAMAGVLHHDVYGAAGILSGYFSPQFPDGSPWPAGSAAAARYDLVATVKRQPPPLAVWLQAGRQSGHWPQTQAFLAAARAPMAVTSEVMAASGHRWDVWKGEVPTVLGWLGANIPGFRP